MAIDLRKDKGVPLALRRFVAIGFLTLVQSTPAAACPSCEIGKRARALVFIDGAFLHLVAVVLPFVVIAAVSLWADGLGRPRRARHRAQQVQRAEQRS